MKRLLFLTVVGALGLAGCATVNWDTTCATEEEIAFSLAMRPRIMARAGGAGEAAANSLDAFRQSLSYGVRAFQVDVGVSPDSALVLAGKKPAPLAELLTLLAPADDLLVSFGMTNAGALPPDDYCDRLYDAVEDALPDDSFEFSSADVALLALMKERHPDARTIYVVDTKLTPEVIEAAQACGATGVSANVRGTEARAVALARKAGLRVELSPVELGGVYRSCVELGVDVAMSNSPVTLLGSARVLAAKADDPAVNQALIPVARLQGDWYDWFARHARIMREKDAMRPQIVFLGDSITHYWAGAGSLGGTDAHDRWKQAFGSWRTLNLGFGWDRTGNLFKRLEMGEMEGLSPDVIVLHIGGNNLTGTPNYPGDTPENVVAANVALAELLHARFPKAHLVVMAVFPFGRSAQDRHRPVQPALNAALKKEMAGRDYVTFIDLTERQIDQEGNYPAVLSADAVHPTTAGYQLWAEALLPVIRKHVKAEASIQ